MTMPYRLEFTVPGPPVPKARARVVRTHGAVHSFTPEKTQAFESTVRAYAMRAVAQYRQRMGLPWLTKASEYRLSCVFMRSQNRGDLDNYIKAIKDALNPPRGAARAAGTIVWPDDARVTSYGPMRMGVDPSAPRTWVCIEAFE